MEFFFYTFAKKLLKRMIKRVLLFLAILFVSLNVSAQKYHFDVNPKVR